MLTQRGEKLGDYAIFKITEVKQETLPGLLLLKVSFYSLSLDLNANGVSRECKVRICGGESIALSLVLLTPNVRYQGTVSHAVLADCAADRCEAVFFTPQDPSWCKLIATTLPRAIHRQHLHLQTVSSNSFELASVQCLLIANRLSPHLLTTYNRR